MIDLEVKGFFSQSFTSFNKNKEYLLWCGMFVSSFYMVHPLCTSWYRTSILSVFKQLSAMRPVWIITDYWEQSREDDRIHTPSPSWYGFFIYYKKY